MKKLIITLLLFTLAAPSALVAQTYTTFGERTIIINEPKKPRIMPKFIWYAKAGVGYGLGKFEKHSDWWLPEVNTFMNFDLALGFQAHFRPSNPSKFYWGAEAGLLIYRANVEYTYFYDSWDKDWKSTEWYGGSVTGVGGFLDLTIGYKTPVSSNILLDIHAAPEFKFGTKPRAERYDQLYFDDYRYSKYNYSRYNSSRVCSNGNYGFKAGAGIWIKKLNIDLSVVKYFSDNSGFYCALPPYLTLSIGYQF